MSTLKKAAIWTTLLALLLKLSGFIRESVVAKEFGASDQTDGYLLAFSFITLVIAMISAGFNSVFLPLYIKRKKSGIDTSDQNANALLNWTIVLFLVVSFAGWLLSPWFVPLIYGDMTSGARVVAIEMTQIFFFGMVFIAIAGLLESYLQSFRIFVPTMLSKLLATLGAAIFAILFIDTWGIYSIAYGFIAGTIVGALIQIYFLSKSDYHWTATFKMDKDFRKAFFILLIPALLNSVVGQINLFVNKYFASGTGFEGAVTYLNNAQLIVSIPNAIYAVTIATIIFTLMAEQTDNIEKFKDTIFLGMEISFISLVPIAVGLFVVGDAVISFIYERGEFTAIDRDYTHQVLILYLPIIIFQGMQLILSKSMYAQGRTSTVFRISVTTIAVNLLLNWWLVDKYGYVALAIAASSISFYYFAVSLVVVYRDLGKQQLVRFLTSAIRVIPAALGMGFTLYTIKFFFSLDTLFPLLQLGILVPIGVLLYVGLIFVFNRAAFTRLLQLVRKKAA